MQETKGTGCDLGDCPHDPVLLRKPRVAAGRGLSLVLAQNCGTAQISPSTWTTLVHIWSDNRRRKQNSTLPPGPPLPAGVTRSSDGLDPGAGPTGLERWLGFCSDSPAAFFLWAAIWDRTLSTLPPEETEIGMTATGPEYCNMG